MIIEYLQRRIEGYSIVYDLERYCHINDVEDIWRLFTFFSVYVPTITYCRYVNDRKEIWQQLLKPDVNPYFQYKYLDIVRDRAEVKQALLSNNKPDAELWYYMYMKDVKKKPDLWNAFVNGTIRT